MDQLAPHRIMNSNIAKRSQRRRVMWWHDSIIDIMLASPHLSLREIAAKLGKAESTIYLITASDVFRHRLAMRRQEHARSLSEDLIANTTKVANKALQLTMERLESGAVAKIPALSLFSLADKALERLGYGVPKAGPAVVVTQQAAFISAPADAIAVAKAMIQRREREPEPRTIADPPASAIDPPARQSEGHSPVIEHE